MTTKAMPTVAKLADVIARLMAGEQVPPRGSPELAEIEDLIRTLQRDAAERDYWLLGAQCLGALIDLCLARIACDEILRDIGDRP